MTPGHSLIATKSRDPPRPLPAGQEPAPPNSQNNPAEPQECTHFLKHINLVARNAQKAGIVSETTMRCEPKDVEKYKVIHI